MDESRECTNQPKDKSRFRNNITFVHRVPAREGVYEPMPDFLPTVLRKLLQKQGIADLQPSGGGPLRSGKRRRYRGGYPHSLGQNPLLATCR